MNEYYPQEPNRDYGYPQSEHAPIMRVRDWVVVFVITAIPLVNIIMLIIWATDSRSNPNKNTYAKASLIMIAVGIVIWVAMLGSMIATFTELFNQLSH